MATDAVTSTGSGRMFVLPGDVIDRTAIPSSRSGKPLRLGPGLRIVPPTDIVPTVAGQLVSDGRKNSMWVEYNGGRYVPSANDLVIGQVLRSAGDLYYVSLGPHTSPATLPHEAFEGGGARKTRPQLAAGQLVYARVALAERHMDAELECVTPATGRADGLGPLLPPGASATAPAGHIVGGVKGAGAAAGGVTGAGAGGAKGGKAVVGAGTAFDVSLGLARRLLMARPREDGGVAVLELLAGEEGLAFETAVGRNGRVWVASESAETVVLVGRALRALDDGDGDGGGVALGLEEQRKLVKRLVRGKR